MNDIEILIKGLDCYKNRSLREWLMGGTPVTKSLILQEIRKMTVDGIKENKPDQIIWIEESISDKNQPRSQCG